ncbi:hypothetical protein [Dyadobacter aurulentus]|uniref:hypothetical protein n=1 Tax=Dyadobacter sp. UC 10 TaxID=2605428 RepID=UPI0011F357C7|nr:hypothetical protein [Dyadobacter sp. UC 10]KAA0992763.1 hypothetical protein FXO21_22590 [Dyadobacter sp. UC 10]
MPYVSAKKSTVLDPEFFRQEALRYNANPTDRKQWLQRQLINLQAALNSYSGQMQALLEQGAKLDGASDVGKWLTTIGGVAIVIPTIYTQIGGAVVSLAGLIVNAAERKKDSKALQQLQGQARRMQLEVSQIKTYYDNYTSELQKINLLPIALFGAAAYLISQR